MLSLLLAVALSLLLCGLYRHFALRLHLLDRPNERSSHALPTPHGGGVGLFAALFAILAGQGELLPPAGGAVLAGTAALVLLGLADDLWQLSVRLRFALYTLICLAAAAPLAVAAGTSATVLPIAVPALALTLLWSLNLYNFMDGIDGLAALQCIAACTGAALLAGPAAGVDYAGLCLLLAAVQLGFLAWNWPPARLFMGDAGSIPTGFLLACLAWQGALLGALPIGCWLILLALFIVDSGWTLLWRLRRGERITQAHRQHAYQRLSRHWRGHRPVLALFCALFLLWLLPLAAATAYWSEFQFFLVILAYIPLLAGMAKVARIA